MGWVTSEKQEYAARTIRPKITKLLPEFLTEFPPVIEHPVKYKGEATKSCFETVYNSLNVDRKGWGVDPVDTFPPGTSAGHKNLKEFVDKRIKAYGSQRNDPNVAALSNMSPWVNMGQVSMQRAVLYVKKHAKSYSESVAGFVEEAVIRRELSDNFCFYNKKYDSIKGATDWAQKTLNDHRMYWAKKVLEWTESPEVALKEAFRLNDRYALDGNDPNGFAGVMWSICGIHDQGWAERAVFGKIRYMNYAGCKRKFDINKFIIKYGAKVHKSKK